jgi:chorismate mutase
MAEVLTPEAQRAADLNAGMRAAVDERDITAAELLRKRAAELADDIAKARERDAKEAEADLPKVEVPSDKEIKANAKQVGIESNKGSR